MSFWHVFPSLRTQSSRCLDCQGMLTGGTTPTPREPAVFYKFQSGSTPIEKTKTNS